MDGSDERDRTDEQSKVARHAVQYAIGGARVRLDAEVHEYYSYSSEYYMRMTSKGQVTIPLAMRQALGLLPNTEVEFELDRDAVRVKKVATPRRHDRGRALIDHMRGRGTRRLTTDEIMKLTRG